MFSFRVFVVLALAASALGRPQYESQLDALADRLSKEVRLAGRHDVFPSALVIDFLDQDGEATAGGEHLADLLSDALRKRLGPAEVLSRRQLRRRLLSVGLSPSALEDSDVALWAAAQMGASLVVFGQVRSSEQKTTLSVGLIQVVDKKKRSIAETDLFLSQEWRSTFDKPLDWPVSSDVVVPCVGPRRDRVAAAFRAAGVSEAICTHCPSPAYTDRARVAKYHGTVKLAMIIGENGRVRSATIIKGDEYGLDATTALAVKEWQLQPGTRDGKPVAVCTLIETAFGVY